MLDYEYKLIATNYKFGILYCRANQWIEDQMYNNGIPTVPQPIPDTSHSVGERHIIMCVCVWCGRVEHGSLLFEEFLPMLGERGRMSGFSRFRGGLDTTSTLHLILAKQLPHLRPR